MLYPAWARRRRRGAPDAAAMEHLASAMASIDGSSVRSTLHREVVLTIDGGGLIPSAAARVEGRVAAASALTALMRPGTSVAMTSINASPGVILARGGMVVAAVTAEMRSGMLSSVWVVCNPEKLRHWNR